LTAATPFEWPKPHGLPEPWIKAVVAADAGNTKPLVALLKEISKRAELPLDVRELLHHTADFLERKKFRDPRGRKRTPSYDAWPPGVENLMAAHVTMRLYRIFMGWSVGDAAEAAAKEHNVKVDALEFFHRDQYGPFNVQFARKFHR
jgi:hypothetical protein